MQIPDRIKKRLVKVAPSILFRVEWEVDPNCRWIGDGPDPRKRGQLAHDVTVSASAIINCELQTGSNCLGACYDKPGHLCPDVHGYLLDMLAQALIDLQKKSLNLLIRVEAGRALDLIDVLQKEQEARWNRRRKVRNA